MPISPTADAVTSADGTTIAFDAIGGGRPVILVGGASYDRSMLAGVAETLAAAGLRAIAYDRRGRGGSTNEDTAFARERELEDLGALIDRAGGSAAVLGHSSGGILALEAAMRGMPIDRVAVYEPPYMREGTRPLPSPDLLDRLAALVRADRRDDAVLLFYTEAVGLPAATVEAMRATPVWSRWTALAHTLPYDLAVYSDYLLPTDRLAALALPALVVDGSASFAWIRATARAAAGAIPAARQLTLAGHDHLSVLQRPDALAHVLSEFLG
jgi:pimeloyl-ACP methyl ester carboxylesterase